MNDLLKFLTCGSVDDGKSTLIGHMLYDAKVLFTDQEKSLVLDSKVQNNGDLDYSLLLDGLMAEREQGITIDVAYRYFSTEKRSFIVADSPGHEEYTRNMAVGASFAQLAVILVDATKGILVQTRRHTRICDLMGIQSFVFAVNKMDMVDYHEEVFATIKERIQEFAKELELKDVEIIPVSATIGDNVTKHSTHMDWYEGPSLLEYLETVNVNEEREEGFVLPIQRVSRPNHSYRGFQGEIACGKLEIGDEITVLPSGETSTVKSILVSGEEKKKAYKGNAVSIELNTEIDVSRGCVIVKDTTPKVSNMFTAKILWMNDEPLIEGRTYFIKLGLQTKLATVTKIKYHEDVNTGTHLAIKELNKNEVAECDFTCSEKIVFDQFKNHKMLGSFILIDRVTHQTAACGTVLHSLRRSDNLSWQAMDITRDIRAEQLKQKPKTIWFTGLSGSGKSALANGIEKLLHLEDKHTMLLDGDNVRMGLNKNLGFTKKDRIENIRRVAEVAKLMNDAGLIVLVSFISPYREDRQMAKQIIGEDNFVEVYVSTPLEECERRDIKGLYKKAREGEIPNFTGINSPYEEPLDPDIVIDTTGKDISEMAPKLLDQLRTFIG